MRLQQLDQIKREFTNCKNLSLIVFICCAAMEGNTKGGNLYFKDIQVCIKLIFFKQ